MDPIDDVSTPTSSQEVKLLNDGNATSSNATNLRGKEKTTANLKDVKCIIDANNCGRSGELTISLDTGEVIIKPSTKRNRNRTSHQRAIAKNGGNSNVNPHDRINDSKSKNGSKRTIEHGDTPPNVVQTAKQQRTAAMGTPVTAETQRNGNDSEKESQTSAADRGNQLPGSNASESEAKSAPKRKRAKKSKNKNAENSTAPEGSETPVNTSIQLFGSKTSGAASNQPFASNEANTHKNPSDANDDNTYAGAVKGNSMAIIDQRAPGQMQLLNDDKFNKLSALLTDIMFSSAGSSEEMPAFEDTRLHSGAMRLRCANEFTLKWLERVVPTLDPKKLWSGAKLVLIAFKDLPKPYKFNVVIRNVKKSPKDIFTLLEKQNGGIQTRSWTVLSHHKRGNDTYMTIGVGQDSFDALSGQSNTLFCGMGKALFTLVKGWKENKNMLHTSAKVNSNSTTVVDQSSTQQNSGRSIPTVVEHMDTNVEEMVIDKPPGGSSDVDK